MSYKKAVTEPSNFIVAGVRQPGATDDTMVLEQMICLNGMQRHVADQKVKDLAQRNPGEQVYVVEVQSITTFEALQ